MKWRDFQLKTTYNNYNNYNNNTHTEELNCNYCNNCSETDSEKRNYALPYFDKCGDIVIPFDSDPKYHWWNGGQSIDETINEFKREKGEK